MIGTLAFPNESSLVDDPSELANCTVIDRFQIMVGDLRLLLTKKPTYISALVHTHTHTLARNTQVHMCHKCLNDIHGQSSWSKLHVWYFRIRNCDHKFRDGKHYFHLSAFIQPLSLEIYVLHTLSFSLFLICPPTNLHACMSSQKNVHAE